MNSRRAVTWSVFLVLTTLWTSPALVSSARILAVEPFPAKSHMVVFTALTKELARRGHEVVVISTFPLSKPMANFTDIDIMPDLAKVREHLMGEKMYLMADMAFWQMMLLMYGMGEMVTETVLNLPQVQAVLEDARGFDLVIVEAFMNEAIYGFADHFKAPLITISPFGGFSWHNSYHSNPAPLSFVPNPMLPFSDHMDLWQRITNVFISLSWELGNRFYYLPKQEAIRKKVFGENSKSIWELEKSVSLSLVNNHFSLSYPRPLMPGIVEVGGLHVMRSPNKLPADLQKFMDEAREGVIYFSMGSNLRSDEMPKETRDALVQAFTELPQKVLWKWESDSLPGQPPNVKLGKWLPQQDILAHPNCRVFMTHGGLLSSQEAIFHGVPVVGIPVFGDQSLNMRKAELAGYGVMVDLKNVTKTSILWAVNKVIHDTNYRLVARKRAAVFRDQPETPLDRAIFWTEYVLRHKGAPHLRSAATRLAWYELHLLDVAAIFVLALVIAFLTLRTACRALRRICCEGGKEAKSKSQSQQSKTDKSKKKKQ